MEAGNARNVSHFIRGGNKSDSPQTVLRNLTQLLARCKSVMFLMPPTLSAWPKKLRLTKRGQMRFWIADFVKDYKLSVTNLWTNHPQITQIESRF